MASFRTHISFGILLGVASLFLLGSLALAPATWYIYLITALAVVVGAIAPDIDSDSGIPFHVTFASLAIVTAGLTAVYVYRAEQGNTWLLLGYPFLAAGFVWGVIGFVFKRFTQHRGMAHSIPAAVLAGLIVFSLGRAGHFEEQSSFIVGIAFSAGYILHLILDEMCSAVNFHGTLFVPNKALGSALKLWSQRPLTTVAVYVVVGILFVQNLPSLEACVARL